MFPWLEINPEVHVGFPLRARNLVPYVREALRYAVGRNSVSFAPHGRLVPGPSRSSFTPAALAATTAEVRDIVLAVRKVGRWFARSGDTSTILAAWGVTV